MNINNVFDDKESKNLRKQIREVQTYIHKELDKSITKQLILRIIEKDYLPILDYTVQMTPNTLPMSYSKKGNYQINIHTPIPHVRLYTRQEYEDTPILKDADEIEELEPRPSFDEVLEDMKQRIDLLDF